MRIFDPEVLLKGFDQLGFSADDLRRWQSMTSQPNGIILVTGRPVRARPPPSTPRSSSWRRRR